MSLLKNKYWKSLLGSKATVLVAKQVAYTTQASYKDFVASAAEGEFGFFKTSDYSLVDGAAVGSPAAVVPVNTATEIFGALKRDGKVETTLPFVPANFKLKRAAYAAQVQQVSIVRTTGAPVAGKFYEVRVIETTPGYQPFPTWSYNVVAKTSETLTQLAQRIVDLVNSTSTATNKDTDPIVTAALVNTSEIALTGSSGSTFRIALSSDALDLGWSADYTGSGTAKTFVGNGTAEAVIELEKQGDILKGVTTQYPMAGGNPDDWGKPTAFAAAGVQYSIYLFTGENTESSPTPVEKHYDKSTIILAIPSNGAANADAAVKGILAL